MHTNVLMHVMKNFIVGKRLGRDVMIFLDFNKVCGYWFFDIHLKK